MTGGRTGSEDHKSACCGFKLRSESRWKTKTRTETERKSLSQTPRPLGQREHQGVGKMHTPVITINGDRGAGKWGWDSLGKHLPPLFGSWLNPIHSLKLYLLGETFPQHFLLSVSLLSHPCLGYTLPHAQHLTHVSKMSCTHNCHNINHTLLRFGANLAGSPLNNRT